MIKLFKQNKSIKPASTKGKGLLLCLLFLLLPLFSVSQLNINYFLQKGKYKLYYYKYSEAIEAFNTVTEHQPNNAKAYYLRGIAKYNLGDFYGAEKDYTQTISLKANYAQAYYYRGMTRIQLYNFQGAIKDFNKTISFITSDAELYIQRGFCKLRLERYKAAIQDFDRSLKKSKNKKKAYYYRAIAKVNLKDTTEAIRNLGQAIETDSTYVLPYVYRGRIYHTKGLYKKALDDYNKAITYEPKNTRALINRSMTYNKLNQLQEAMEDLNKVIKTEPSNALAYYNRALLRTQIGDYDKAIEDYNQVLKFNPQNILSYFNRGIVHMRKNSYGNAIRDFTMAIRYYPDFAKAYMNRAVARKRLQDYKGAQKDRQKAKQIFAAYQKNELNQLNFADTSENFRRLISLQSSQNLPKQFSKSDQSIEPFGLYSIYYNNKNKSNITRTIEKYLQDEANKAPMDFLDENFVFDYSNNSETSPEEHLEQIKDIEKQLQGNSTNSAWKQKYKMALLKSYRKNYNGAIEDLTEIIHQKKDTNFLAYYTRANIRYRMTEYIRMMEDESKIIQINLDSKFIEQPISRQVTIHDYKKVIDDYNQAVRLAPKFVYNYYNRANVKVKNKNYSGAIADYNKAILLENDFAEAYFNRGLTYIHLQKTTKGCIDLSRAGELGIDKAYRVINIYCK